MAKKLTKKQTAFIQKSYSKFDAVETAFLRLVTKHDAWKKAMLDRIQSCCDNKPIASHDWTCGNSHQRQIDDFREAAFRFAELLGFPYRKMYEAAARLENKIMEQCDEQSIV